MIACAYRFSEHFSLAAYLTGGLLVIFALVHYRMLSFEAGIRGK